MLAVLLSLLVGAQAMAQMPGPAPVATDAAPADTAVATFSWASPAAAPTALTIWPDDALFGQELVLILDHAHGVLPEPLDSLRVDAPWLDLVPEALAPGDLPLPPSEGVRQLARVRIYREGPWRPVWEDGPAASVQVVRGRVDDPMVAEPVRDPRGIGGIPVWVVVLATIVLLVLLASLMVWRWRRRRERWEPAHRALEPPAWLSAAMELRDLEQQSLLAREHLDGLAAVLRRYVRGRFYLPAEEMTAPEILVASCAAGWHRQALTGFAELLAAWDDARYAPDRVGSREVHRAVGRALDLMEITRIEPVWTPVPPADLAAARAAWDLLRQRYPGEVEPGSEERTAC